jgi:hypothetical protein
MSYVLHEAKWNNLSALMCVAKYHRLNRRTDFFNDSSLTQTCRAVAII